MTAGARFDDEAHLLRKFVVRETNSLTATHQELGALSWPHVTVRIIPPPPIIRIYKTGKKRSVVSRDPNVGFGIGSERVKKLSVNWVITLHVQLNEEEAELLTLLFLTRRDSLQSGLADCWHQRDFYHRDKVLLVKTVLVFFPPFSKR